MNPEPFGERLIPPRILTAVGTAEDGHRTVAIQLSDEREQTLLARAFELMGWRVELSIWAFAIGGGVTQDVQLVVSDSRFVIEWHRESAHHGKPPHYLLIAPYDYDLVEMALDFGIDGVMLRSVDSEGKISYDVVFEG